MFYSSSKAHKWHKLTSCLLIVGLLMSLGLTPAEAKKKKKKGGNQKAQAELQKEVTTLTETITTLSGKIRSRTLFSPEDSSQLDALHIPLLALIHKNPKSELIIQPTYQAAMVFRKREQFVNAYELFQFLNEQHADTPYGNRARFELRALKKQLGNDYFSSVPEAGQISATPTTPQKLAKNPTENAASKK